MTRKLNEGRPAVAALVSAGQFSDSTYDRAIKIAENFLVEEMTGRAIMASDESDRTSYTGPYSRHRSESFEYFRLWRSDHRHIGQPSRHVQERSLRPFQIQGRD